MKILLITLPPSDINTPSISLSILKKFMINHGFETKVAYWNFYLSLMQKYSDSEDTEIRLLPFLSILNDKYKYSIGNKRIISLLQKIDSSHKAFDSKYYEDLLNEMKDTIFDVIQQYLKTIDFKNISIIGFSAKYNQWIPAMIIAEEIKKIAPHTKIIVGGFGREDVAQEAIKTCSYFDYTTWGEGEYPLLALMQQLNTLEPEFHKVSRLMYRQNNKIIQSTTSKSEYLDFENYIYPDYNDFFKTFPKAKDQDNIHIPINSIRSCPWKKCKFCDFNQGYKLRLRSPQCILNEIEHLNKTYGSTIFSFVDSDTFVNSKHFEELLDLIIDLKFRTEEDLIFWAEIIPNSKFTVRMMKKMAIIGLKNIFIGYDGLSDSLLQKMNKSNSFSDNIFFVKFSLKYGIDPYVNVIKYLPNETEEDIRESIENLHFLRFFYHDQLITFSHNFVSLVLSSMTKYYSLMPDKELDKYNRDDLSNLMPEHFSNTKERFRLFRFAKDTPRYKNEWEQLEKKEQYYRDNKFTYKMIENDGIYYYSEYCNHEETENIVFGEAIYGIVLKTIEKKIYSFSELHSTIKKENPDVTHQHLKQVLYHLKSSFLVYYSDDFSNIISVIEL